MHVSAALGCQERLPRALGLALTKEAARQQPPRMNQPASRFCHSSSPRYSSINFIRGPARHWRKGETCRNSMLSDTAGTSTSLASTPPPQLSPFLTVHYVDAVPVPSIEACVGLGINPLSIAVFSFVELHFGPRFTSVTSPPSFRSSREEKKVTALTAAFSRTPNE